MIDGKMDRLSEYQSLPLKTLVGRVMEKRL